MQGSQEQSSTEQSSAEELDRLRQALARIESLTPGQTLEDAKRIAREALES